MSRAKNNTKAAPAATPSEDQLLASARAAGSAFEPFDFVYALDNAAEFLEREEWPDPDTRAAQEAANKAAAKRIRAMANRYANKHIHPSSPNKVI